MSNTGDVSFRKELGTGDHVHDFRCFDTINRLVCCICGALAYPEDLVRQGLEDIKAGRIHKIPNIRKAHEVESDIVLPNGEGE